MTDLLELHKRIWVGTLLCLSMGFLTPALQAQITPHSALKNFKLPKYNENSYRAYTLSGTEGIYDTAGFFKVTDAVLSIYSGDIHQIMQTSITSKDAVFDLRNDTASGDSFIEVRDDKFFLSGKSWSLDMENRRITIKSEGTIHLYQKLDLDLSEIF